MYKISEVAKLSKITVRTLHYYDEINLLSPSVDNNGYRLYSDYDIEKLQQILFFRELEFSLKEIKEIINSPLFNRKKALLSHRDILIKKKNRLEKIIETVNKSLNEIEKEVVMSKEEMFNGFSMKEINECKNKYAKEVKNKYGNTKAYTESKKVDNYSKEKWEEIINEANEIYIELSNHLGESPESECVQNLVEKWRNHISKNYYNCTLEIFEGLSDMYVYNERFTENIDRFGKGLADFLSKGIKVYCSKRKK